MSRCIILSAFLILVANISHSATLHPRYGGQAYYDPDTNVTWLTNANSQGRVSWQAATDWAQDLVIASADQWALPGVAPGHNLGDCTAGVLSECVFNPFGYLHQVRGIRDNNQGVFSNIQTDYYWSRQKVYEPYSGNNVYWMFSFDSTKNSPTLQLFDNPFSPTGTGFAWALHSGDPLNGLTVDVSPVPVPAAVWMFGASIAGVFGILRRRKRLV